jgi:hypothetical protein
MMAGFGSFSVGALKWETPWGAMMMYDTIGTYGSLGKLSRLAAGDGWCTLNFSEEQRLVCSQINS